MINSTVNNVAESKMQTRSSSVDENLLPGLVTSIDNFFLVIKYTLNNVRKTEWEYVHRDWHQSLSDCRSGKAKKKEKKSCSDAFLASFNAQKNRKFLHMF